MILGTLAIFRLPKDLLPSANLPAVQIISFYPGMPVKDVEQTLTARFERNTGQAIGIERQESKSLVGVSIVRNFFTPETDQNFAISQTTSLVISVLGQLPPGTLPPYIIPFDPMAAVPLALVVVEQRNKSIEHVYDTARYEVRNAIQAVQGAMAPTVMGGTLREVVIFLDPKKIKYYNFSPLNVLNKLTRLNSFIPSGDVKIGDFDYQIESNALVQKISDFNEFPLRGELGVPVYVKDIGHASDSGLIQTNVVLINGQERVYVPIYRQPGGNTIQIVDNVRKAIKHLESIFKGTNPTYLSLVADQSTFIRHAIDSITEEALLGGGLAAVMIFLFLGNPRATFGILISIPLSLLLAFIGLEATNQSINAMTLGGLALSIGVLVDNSIVVLENINKKLETGKTAFQSALEGASEVALPVLASTTATLIVLFPVVFLTGIVKILFSALAKAVMFVMIGSYIAAMTVMPLFASRCLRPISVNQLPHFFRWIHKATEFLTEFYGILLAYALRFRGIVLIGVVGLFLVGLLLVPSIGTELFPRTDAGSLVLNLRLHSGTRIELTTAFARTFDKKLREWIEPHDLHMIIANAGIGYGFPAAFTPNVGTQDVFFNIELTKNREHTSQYYAKVIREHVVKEFPDVEMGVELGGLLSSALNMGIRAPIDIQIEGPELQESYKIAQLLAEKIKKLPGAVDVRIQQRFDDPTIYIDIDRKKAMNLGIFTDEVVKNIDSAVTGSSTFDTSSLWIDPKTGIDYFLAVQIPQNNVATFNDLKNVPIRGFDRNRVLPLENIATISKTTGWTQINHVNFRSVINIYLDAENRDIGGLSSDVANVIRQTKIPEYYTANIRGEISEMKKSIGLLGGGFILAATLVYLILVVQFKSFLQPLIIMVSVPLGLIGIVFMFSLTKTYFSIQAAIGAIFMIGIAVANGVLLIEFITHHLKMSSNINQGIVTGAKARLRPILMTSLAAILGLIPMAIGLGHGTEANIPLGRAVIGGQLVSTLLTLFIVPILYRSMIKTETKTS
jgi:multidrug efflux pump subunit AcrB